MSLYNNYVILMVLRKQFDELLASDCALVRRGRFHIFHGDSARSDLVWPHNYSKRYAQLVRVAELLAQLVAGIQVTSQGIS